MTVPPTIPPTIPPASPAPPVGSGVPTADECSTAMLLHICMLLHTVGLVIALVLWASRKDQSRFIDHHGKQAIAFVLASLVVAFIVVALCFVCVGFVLLPLYVVAHLVLPILAAMAANRGEWYKYPVIGDLIK